MVEYLQTPVPCYRIAFLAKQEVEGSNPSPRTTVF